jgi:hypothetical protein
MAFWTQDYGAGTKDPKRKYRFKVKISQIDNNGCIWWAKTVTKPNYEITESEHTFLTHKFYYPGRVSWGEVEMVLVDPVSPGAVADLNAMIQAQGYHIPGEDLAEAEAFQTMSKAAGADSLGVVEIQQLDAEGTPIETWTLKNPFIKGVKYGDLDYSSDDLLEVTLTLRYDWATCVIGADAAGPKIGNGPDPEQREFFTAGAKDVPTTP